MSNTHQEYQNSYLVFNEEFINIISLKNWVYSIGRDFANDIVLESGTVSRFHAKIEKVIGTKGGYYQYKLVDGKSDGTTSRNGVLVNNQRVSEHCLADGDLISFGGVIHAIFRTSNLAATPDTFKADAEFLSCYTHPSLSKDEPTSIML